MQRSKRRKIERIKNKPIRYERISLDEMLERDRRWREAWAAPVRELSLSRQYTVNSSQFNQWGPHHGER